MDGLKNVVRKSVGLKPVYGSPRVRTVREITRASVGIGRSKPAPRADEKLGGVNKKRILGRGPTKRDVAAFEAMVRRVVAPLVRQIDELKMVNRSKESVDPRAFVAKSRTKLSDFKPKNRQVRKRVMRETYRARRVSGSFDGIGRQTVGLTARAASRRSMGLPDDSVELVERSSVRLAMDAEAANQLQRLETVDINQPLLRPGLRDPHTGMRFTSQAAMDLHREATHKKHDGSVPVFLQNVDSLGRKR